MNYGTNPVILKRKLRNLLPLRDYSNYVFIVGAQKAGTTSLHSYLASHPLITGGDNKELNFFNREKFYPKGMAYYRSLFPAFSPATHALDSTPVYMHSSKAAERIHAFSHDAKIIMLLREPLSRAFSAFNMYQQIIQNEWFKKRLRYANDDSRAFFIPLVEGKIKLDIHYFLEREIAIMNGDAKSEEPALIRRGIYAPQLERFICLFGRENVLVLFNDELRSEPEKTVNKVFSFIGLEPLFGIEYPLKHVREYTVDDSIKYEIQHYAGTIFDKDKKELISNYGLVVPW